MGEGIQNSVLKEMKYMTWRGEGSKSWETALLKWDIQRDCQIKVEMNSTGFAGEEGVERI